MELWIRSQDKTALKKCKDIRIYYDNRMYLENRDETAEIWLKDNEMSLCMGIYATEERALEVLDEIQSKIKNQYIVEVNSFLKPKYIDTIEEELNYRYKGDFIIQPPLTKLQPVNYDIIIYEMPEE